MLWNKRIFFLFVLLFNSPLVFAHRTTGAHESLVACERLLDSSSALGDLFNDADFGKKLVEFLLESEAEIYELESNNPQELSRMAATASGRAKLKLVNYARESVFPIFVRHAENFAYLNDVELSSLAHDEHGQIATEMVTIKDQLFQLLSDVLLPGADSQSVLIEVVRSKDQRANTEWNRRLTRMYLAAAPHMKWSAELISEELDADGGVRRALIRIKGPRAYQLLQFERGTHRAIIDGDAAASRANRNRTHTNFADVLVYDEPTFSEVILKPQDIHIESMRASGAGGQHVNRTDSAVRVRHLPTGLEVHIQSHRSQHANRAEALKILTAKLQALTRERDQQTLQSARGARAVNLGDDSRYVRTYDSRYNRTELESLLVHGNLGPSLYAKLMQALKLRFETRQR